MHRKFIILLLTLTTASAELSDIIKLCRNVSCDVDSEYENITETDPRKSFQWITAGLPQIFWNAVADGSLFNQTSLSKVCKRQLNIISDAMSKDEEWAFHFADAAGKAPAGILRATVTAIGDYDQCLDIDYYGIQGMYCMLDTYPLKKNKSSAKQLALSQVNVFRGFPFFSTLCLPSACGPEEIQKATKNLLKPFLIKVDGDITCDTKEQISWSSRISKLTRKQIISITAITSILATVFFSTSLDVIQRLTGHEMKPLQSDLLKSLSVMDSTRRLFFAKPWKFDVLVFDSMKLVFLLFATLAHLLLCVESPHGIASISAHKYLNQLMIQPSTQFLTNDSGLLGMPFLSGIATFAIIYPIAMKKKLNFIQSLIQRVIRFLPPILVLTACEFIWPILGSGPFYKRVADFLIYKCEKNWIHNILFTNTMLQPSDICGAHLFSSSIDMQLFAVGLVCMLLFSKSEKAGVGFCFAMIIFGTFKVAYNAITYNTALSMFVVSPAYDKTVEFMYYIHMQTPSYLAAYFTGFLICYFRSKGYLTPDLSSTKSNLAFLLLTSILNYSVNLNAMMHNIFNLYPQSLNWLFISLNRILQLSADACTFTYFMSFKQQWERNQQLAAAQNNGKHDPEEETIRPFKALCRLGFPLYICNYLYIRTEFFTRTFLQSGGAFWIIKRLVSSMIFVYIFTFVFHICLLAPVDSIREYLTTRSTKKTEKREHSE